MQIFIPYFYRNMNKWTYHPIVISVDTNSNDHAKEKEIKCAL